LTERQGITIYAESNTQGAIKIGKFGRVIEAAWEGPRLADGSYNWQAGDDTSSLFNVFMDDHDQEKETEEYEAPQRRTPNWQRKLKRTLCVNAPVQGACADVSMLALLYANHDLRDAEIRGGVVLFIHDELVAEVAEADAERAKEIIKAAMTRGFSEVFPDAPLSDLVDAKISRTWDPDDKPADTAGSAAEPADGPTLPARGVPQPGGDNGTRDAPHMPPHEDRIVARALAKLTKGAARTGRDLASLRQDAEVLPLKIRRQLSIVIEEADLLCRCLHEEP
jgi:hypothetical protein